MNKILCALFLVMSLTVPVFADMDSKLVIMEKADIAKSSDEKLTDAYMDTVVEIEAIKTFHTTSGFTPKQYDEYRSLLKYRLQLLMEIHTRNIEIPQQMEH